MNEIVEFFKSPHILAIIYTALQILDYASTRAILNAGGRELNPIVGWFMEKFGEKFGLFVIKLFGIGLGWYVATSMVSPHNLVVLTILIAVYLVVVVHNLKVMVEEDIGF